ncbi:MAG: reverse transcriptase domain-containing protein [Eisenbergiella massiliensis]|uniref:reverse transcriptase domain-containing protein n=1 Tax=Eisenbergiella massiliensis TaxID=1720294 RepID=UPI0039935C04
MQKELKKVLKTVFESHFYDDMMGFRSNRGCHIALRKLNVMIEKNATNYILDVDVKGGFGHIDHEWAIKFNGAKIKDSNILWLVRKMLKAGSIEGL